MANKTNIEYVDRNHNWVFGCREVGADCDNCYAKHVAHRFGPSEDSPFYGLTKKDDQGQVVWSGALKFSLDKMSAPLFWQDGTWVFTNTMSDVGFKDIPDRIFRAWAGFLMVCSVVRPNTVHLAFTKRPSIVAKRLNEIGAEGFDGFWSCFEAFQSLMIPLDRLIVLRAATLYETEKKLWPIERAIYNTGKELERCQLYKTPQKFWPLPNVYWMVSVGSNEQRHRIKSLFDIPAVVRGVSAEPLIGPLDLFPFVGRRTTCMDCGDSQAGVPDEVENCGYCKLLTDCDVPVIDIPSLDWIIVGGESGASARRMEPQHLRDLVELCDSTGTPLFLKQWGAFDEEGNRVGKKNAGALLDGRHIHQFPKHAGDRRPLKFRAT